MWITKCKLRDCSEFKKKIEILRIFVNSASQCYVSSHCILVHFGRRNTVASSETEYKYTICSLADGCTSESFLIYQHVIARGPHEWRLCSSLPYTFRSLPNTNNEPPVQFSTLFIRLTFSIFFSSSLFLFLFTLVERTTRYSSFSYFREVSFSRHLKLSCVPTSWLALGHDSSLEFLRFLSLTGTDESQTRSLSLWFQCFCVSKSRRRKKGMD